MAGMKKLIKFFVYLIQSQVQENDSRIKVGKIYLIFISLLKYAPHKDVLLLRYKNLTF